jgi:hypothetical protein
VRIFARGFQNRIDARWLSSHELRSALEEATQRRAPPSYALDRVLVASRSAVEIGQQRRMAIAEAAEDAADIVAGFLEPQRIELSREVDLRRDRGLEIVAAPQWNGNSTSLAVRELVKLAAAAPGKIAPGVFHLTCGGRGIKRFFIYLEMVFAERMQDTHVPVKMRLYLRHEEPQRNADAAYVLGIDGRAYRGSQVERDDLLRTVLSWIDDPQNWSYPA